MRRAGEDTVHDPRDDIGPPYVAGRDRVGDAGRGHTRAPHLGELGPPLLVSDDHEMPALTVASGGRLDGQVHAFFEELTRHRASEVEAVAYRAGGGEQLVGREVESHVLTIAGGEVNRQRTAFTE